METHHLSRYKKWIVYASFVVASMVAIAVAYTSGRAEFARLRDPQMYESCVSFNFEHSILCDRTSGFEFISLFFASAALVTFISFVITLATPKKLKATAAISLVVLVCWIVVVNILIHLSNLPVLYIHITDGYSSFMYYFIPIRLGASLPFVLISYGVSIVTGYLMGRIVKRVCLFRIKIIKPL